MSWGGLQDELKRKREQVEAAKKLTEGASVGAGDGIKKYVRRGDVGKSTVSDLSEAGAPSSRATTGAAAPPALSEQEVESRLRSYGLPVTLFGEVPTQRLRRLHAHEHRLRGALGSAVSSSSNGPAAMGGLSGGAAPEDPTLRLEHGALGEPSAASSLPPAKRRRLEDDEADSSAAPATSARRVLESSPVLGGAHEVVAGAGSAAGAAETTAAEASAALDVGRDGCDDEDARSTGSKQSKDRSGARTKAADATRYRPVPGNAHANQHKYAYKWIRGMLNEWEDELATRSAAEAMSARGREEASLWQQSTQYVRPLLRRLRSKSVPADILKLVVEIVGHCEDREYAVAGDAYVRLAIGNAAWPIGVTAVGLHERAAREKVYEGRQAHVMHNEESRKYVTILKRLISLAQRKWPAEPSKSVYS